MDEEMEVMRGRSLTEMINELVLCKKVIVYMSGATISKKEKETLSILQIFATMSLTK